MLKDNYQEGLNPVILREAPFKIKPHNFTKEFVPIVSRRRITVFRLILHQILSLVRTHFFVINKRADFGLFHGFNFVNAPLIFINFITESMSLC